jgi:GNAT superfamily N-acetyltransferase
MSALEFREARLQELWRQRHPEASMPTNVAALRSWECVADSQVVGHCAGDATTGEIVGLSVIPTHQGRGIGKRLLAQVVSAMRAEGANRIWVAAPSDPAVRAYGFYRAVGWRPTGGRTPDGSEILELQAVTSTNGGGNPNV